ncbi:MAG: DUF1592 domain-containing protein [Verrucomicrobiales bacterium]|nr:DUF1592 domain-containing protein [Verrucomicrobiales bacterium]
MNQIQLKLSSHGLLLATALLPCSWTEASEAPTKELSAFFEKHCHECHDDLTTKGGLDLYALSRDLSDPATITQWIRIYDRITDGEMPPPEKPQPSPGEKRIFGETLAPSLASAHERQKGTVLRRLNRKEYENTLTDMLGVRLDIAGSLPEDGRSGEFDTVGEALGISMIQMQEYLRAADTAIDTAIAKTSSPPKVKTISASYAETSGAEKFIGKAWLKAKDGAVVFFREMGYPSGMLREANSKEAGYYRIRVTGYAYQSDKPVTFSVGSTTFDRGAEKPIYGYYSLPPGNPSTIELTAWVDRNYMIEITPKGIFDEENKIKDGGLSSYPDEGLAISKVELEGPIVAEFPSEGHQLIFAGLKRTEIEPSDPKTKTKSWYKPSFEILSDDPTADVAPVLKRFATLAFRKPARDEDIAPYLILFQGEMTKGESFEEALQTALSAILTSPRFLFLHEPAGKLDDYAVASRLSYFLTRTLPDAGLLSNAADGRLASDAKTLRKHVNRLINSPHFERFVTDFTDSWLDLRSIDFTAPDSQLFPEYDSYLQESILAETRSYFHELVRSNHGIEFLVKSDFSMLNSRLAEHYGIEGITSPTVEKVSLPADSVRGGFLSHASIHKVSANGTNTSPVLRGVWINERILGRHPAPPPPGIPGVEPDIRGAGTLRELLDKHRDSESCQSCHGMIDPPGFALESFNPIGGWRDRFRSLGEGEKPEQRRAGNAYIRYKIGPPVDSSGQLQGGESFAGFREYRNLIAQDRKQLAKALLTKFLTFGTGREMGFSDRPEINRLVSEAAKTDYGIRDLISLAVTSEIFLHK